MSTELATPPSSGTAGVPANQRPNTLKGWLQSDEFRSECAKALPKHCSPERLMRIAINALSRTPKLADCTQESVLRCMLDLSQWGLEPNGRDAHLIPYGKECQLILDYKGIVQLLYRSGQVQSVHADVVHAGDDFFYTMGEVQRHTQWYLRPDTERPQDEGDIVAAYCRVVLKGGAIKCEVMSREQIDKVRSRSRAGKSGPWVTDYAEMAKKTVFRRCSKWLPLSAEIVDAFDRDFDTITVEPGRPTGGGLEGLRERLEAPTEGSPATLDEPPDGFDLGDQSDELFDKSPNAAEA